MKTEPSTTPLDLQGLDELILKVLSRNRFGLTVAKIRRDLPPAYRASAKQINARLDVLLGRGLIHAWPPFHETGTKPTAPIFSLEPLEPLISGQIVQWLSTQPLPLSDVKKRLPAHVSRHLAVFLDPLLKNRKVKHHPPLKGKRLLSLMDPDPVGFLGAELKKLFARGIKLGFSGEAVAQSAQRYLKIEQPKEVVRSPAEIEKIIFKAMTFLKPAAAQGALVYIPDLRRALCDMFPDKDSFDRAIIHLAELEKVQLQSHSLPAELTDEEKAAMIDNGRSSYFMAVGIRME
jgi:hypothetical protein